MTSRTVPVAPDSAITSETQRHDAAVIHVGDGAGRIEISMIGSINAVWTSATLSADDVICVIAQAAPDALDHQPEIESRLASQMRPEYRIPQRRGDAVGGKCQSFRLFGHLSVPLPRRPA